MVYVGMDHGTTGISFSILSKNPITFKLGREELSKGNISVIEELSKRVEIDEIDLMAITYAMGDGITRITPIKKLKDRGIISIGGAGKVTGGGTKVFDDIRDSKIPTIVIPGLHKNTPCMDLRFRKAYSHHASAEKVSICYQAFLNTGWENMIVSDISSNTVSILIENAKIKGAIDACLGAMGIIHGPLDLEMLREIDDGKKSANQCFSRAGAIKIANIDTKVGLAKEELLSRLQNGDMNAKLAIETMIMTIIMEIHGLAGIAQDIDGIVLTGSIGSMKHPYNFFNKLKAKIDSLAPTVSMEATSGSLGSANIAKAVHNGEKEILGILVA